MNSLDELLKVDVESRDEAWEKRFLSEIPNARVSLVAPEPQQGPDHWPYLMITTEGDAVEPLPRVLEWLSTRGIGLVINPQKTMPDYVLSYGMVWNFRERGEFLTQGKNVGAGSFQIEAGQEVLTGPPSEAYLPPYVRTVIKQFLADQGAFSPRVLMVSFDKENYDLCFSIESLKSPPAHEHAGIAEAISWFLPAHYSVSLISEKTIPGFQAL